MPERPPARSAVEGPPEECANCGSTIPRAAKSCPDCGADERTGWRETSVYDRVDLPDEAFGEVDSIGRAASHHRAQRRAVNGVAWYWWCVGIALIVLLGFGALALI